MKPEPQPRWQWWLSAGLVAASLAGVFLASSPATEAEPAIASAPILSVSSLTQFNGNSRVGTPVPSWAAVYEEDHSYLVTASSNVDGGWDGQVFRFTATPPANGYGRLNVVWRGFGEPSSGYLVRLDIFNLTTGQWELERTKQTVAFGSNVELTLTITNGFEQYVDGDGSVWVRVRADNLELYPPEEFSVRAAASHEVRLSWRDPNENESGYGVFRENELGEKVELATLPANSTVYTDLDEQLTPGIRYTYRVYAVRDAIDSPSVSADVVLPAAGKRLDAAIRVPDDAPTIQEAVNLAKVGDTVVVKAGTYRESVVVREPGVTLRGEDGVHVTTIAPLDNCREEFCAAVTVATQGLEPVVVEDFTLANGLGSLVRGDKVPEGRVGGGLLVYGSAAILRRLDVNRNHVLGYAEPNGSAIALVEPGTVTVENVVAYGNLGDYGSAVFIWGGRDTVLLRHLTVFGNGSGHPRTEEGPWGLDVVDRVRPVYTISSIFWNNGPGYEVGSKEKEMLEIGYSVVGGDLREAIDLGMNLFEDPLLESYEAPQLRDGSPAIDWAKSEDAPADDYEGNARPVGGGYDVGASEYGASGKAGDKTGGSGTTKSSLEVAALRPIVPNRGKLQSTAVPSWVEYRPSHASLNTDFIDLEVVEVTPPAAPQNLATFGVGPTEVSLRWIDAASDEEGFTVYRDGAVVTSIQPSSGVGSQVVFTDYGADLPTHSLTPGQMYCYQVSAYREGIEAFSDAACATTLEEAGDPPAAPTGLTAAGFSATQINLSWADHAAAPNPEDGFNVYRRIGGEAEGNLYVLVNSPVPARPGTGTVGFGDRGLDLPGHELEAAHTYCYRVAAYNRYGESAQTDEACAQVLPETLIRAYQFGGDAGDAPLYDPDEHVLDLSQVRFLSEQSCGSPCTLMLETDYAELFVEDEDLDLNNVFNSQLFVLHLDTPPEGLSSLNLEWRGRGESRADRFVRLALYNFSTGSWVTQLEQSIENLITFTTSTPATRLGQFVSRVNDRPYTVLLWVRGRAYIPPPAAPANLRLTDDSPTSLTFEWDDVATTEGEYVVARADANDLFGEWSDVVSLPANTTRYTDDVPVATDWRYRVFARQRTLRSDPSNTVEASTPLYPPKSINVTALDSSSIRVAWQLDSKNPALPLETVIERHVGLDDPLAPWEVVHQTAAGETSWVDSGLERKTFYSYRARHKANDGSRLRESVYSSVVYTSTPDASAPAAPTDLTATPLTYQVNLNWKDNATNETAYVVERQLKLVGVWQTVTDSLPPNTTSFGDSGLQPGAMYGYRVKARNGVGDSPYSNEAFVTTAGTAGTFTIRSTLPARNGSAQGMAVLASHAGYVYAASADVDLGSGKEPWRHLNVWRSTDGGERSPWEWVGETSRDIPNNVPAAMVSYKGVLVLVSGSNVWSSEDDGATWALRLGKGIGSWQSNGFHTHLTVYENTLYALLEGGTLYHSTNGTGWSLSNVPPGARALAQWNSKLVTYAEEGSRVVRVYVSNPGVTEWYPQGNVLGDDPNPDCDALNGIIGVGSKLYAGGTGTIPPYSRCLRVSSDGLYWSRVGVTDIGPGVLLPDVIQPLRTAIVGSNDTTPEVVAQFIDSTTGAVQAVGVAGLENGTRLWSMVNFNGQIFGTAFVSAGGLAGRILLYEAP